MSDKIKNSHQRLKILYLYKILFEMTDEEHILSMPEIISNLERFGISAGRLALYEDIEALRAFGLDIIKVRGNKSGYYVASRDFELPELKLLADAVSSSRFLTEKKSAELIKKLGGLASVYESRQIQRQVFVADRVKSMNERIYLNVDVINRAIDEEKQIEFDYFDYDINKNKHYRSGKRNCHPYALAWADERYYLIAYYEKYDSISNFRIDRMENVEIINASIKPKPKNFIVAEYLNSTFSMFSGNIQPVKLRFANELVNVVIDRFGKDVTLIGDEEGYFSVRAEVRPTKTFFGWLFQFGDSVEIISPDEVREQYFKQLENVMNKMKGI